MSAPLRKGWCPGALRPMPAKDGLLVRLRITGGILAADNAMALAELAERYGNGLFDLSTRGNLQMRGVREESLATLQEGLSTLALIDRSAASEAVRNVIASPLAGLHDGLDIRWLSKALEDRLVADTSLHGLPAKFGFLIDDGCAPSLADIPADIRFDWTGHEFSIRLGHDALPVGLCNAADLVTEAARIANIFLERFADPNDVRRVRDVSVSELRTVFAPAEETVSRDRQTMPVHDLVGYHTITTPERSKAIAWLGLAAPFGRLDAAMLRAAASVATTATLGELRLTPWRVILVPGASPRADAAGFITDPADPRLAVAACVGIDGCANATTDVRADAERLARDLDFRVADGIAVHGSGCAKGCAKATQTPITLVARGGRYDIVLNGRAGDPPQHRGLHYDGVRQMLAAMKVPA